MSERICYSTQDFVLVKADNQETFGLDGVTIFSEGVLFEGNCNGVANIFRYTDTGDVESLDHIIHDLDKGVTVYYDHNYWAPPFSHKLGFEPDPNGPYKAVIHLSSVSRGKDDRLASDVSYGTFWYDQEGVLKAINGGSITQTEWDSAGVPTLKFRRMPSGNWQVFRLSGIQESFRSYALEGKTAQPENVEIFDGKEIEFDEIISSLTDSAGRFRFHQRTLTNHRQKTIEVPSRIDIPRWVMVLNTLNGGWTRALSEFPTRVELLI